ncbi:aminotransferase-like domain-containing protein [Chitinophaga lutea]
MKVYKHEAFTNAIEKNIREGVFQPGQKLPSVRELKERYQASTSTIQSGYAHLVARGWVESVPKSGYYVSRKQRAKPARRPVAHDPVFRYHLKLTTASYEGAEFNVAAPGDLFVPQKLLLRTMQQVIREEGAGLLRYYPANGSPALRDHIVRRAAFYQTILHPDELLVTDGALQALYIALSAVCKAGDVIAIESPCVFSVLEVVRVLQLRVVEIPVDPVTGFDIDLLKKACRHHTLAAVVVTPNFHNPTGTLLTDEQKRHLLSIVQHHHIPLIENDLYGDLHFGEQRPSNIKRFDESGLVLTYTSFAKTLAPGIRLGWLSAGKFMQRAEQIRFALGSTVAPLYQETVGRLLAGSSYDRHVRSFRRQLAKNAEQAVQLITEHFPEGTSVHPPAGGYHLWVKMPEHRDMARFYERCGQIGIRFTPGYTFSFTGAYDPCFRLVFADRFTPRRIAALRKAGQ